jgi:hypothetical protein
MKLQKQNWTLMVMKILRIPQVKELNPFASVSMKQIDALAEYVKDAHTNRSSVKLETILLVLKENA